MGMKVDALVEELKAEQNAGNPPQDNKPQETEPPQPTETETPPAENTEPKPSGNPPQDTPPADDGNGGNGDEPPKGKPSGDDDPLSRAEFSFRRKLEKANRKHEADLAERDKKYNELKAQFEELKKTVAPKEAQKTREDFANDEAYVDYLVGLRVNKILAERDGKEAERRANEAEEKKAAKAQEAEIVEAQQRWLGHVDKCFEGDDERKNKFLSKVQYANKNGLGEILDNCPTASDYFLNNPNGPKVFEKILNDRNTFVRVFNERSTPLDVYYELRSLEKEINAQPSQATGAQPPAPKPQTMPKIGKPGKQAGAGTKPDIFNDHDAMISFIRSR